MDPEIKKALANIKRRKMEIERRHGPVEDDGPMFGRARSDYKRLKRELEQDSLLDDYEDDEVIL